MTNNQALRKWSLASFSLFYLLLKPSCYVKFLIDDFHRDRNQSMPQWSFDCVKFNKGLLFVFVLFAQVLCLKIRKQ